MYVNSSSSERQGTVRMWSDTKNAETCRFNQWYTVIAVLAASTITVRGLTDEEVSSFCETFTETFGFACTEYKMLSAQGFQLAMHRIGSSAETNSRASPVLLMHSEFLNGDCWFQFTDAADKLLPLLLIDAGFDVWVGHERATYWSHGHLYLETTDKGFWNWTWDDHAQYDVPVMLEYINETTGFAAHYVGLSQSATVGAATATMLANPLLIRSLTLIGPTIYTGDTNSVLLDAWAFIFGIIDEVNYETGYQSGAFNFTAACPDFTSISAESAVALAFGMITGPNCCLGTAAASFTNGWDGTNSIKNLLHYQQGIRSNTWRRFDYKSASGNTQAYGVPIAPTYNPADIPTKIPVLVIYGGNDAISPPAGVRHLLSQLRNVNIQSVYLKDYAHLDLLWSSRRTQDIFFPVLRFLKRH